MKQSQANFIGAMLMGVFIVAVVLGIYAAVWMIWCEVMTGLFPASNSSWTDPAYWHFVGAFFLLKFVSGAIVRSVT